MTSCGSWDSDLGWWNSGWKKRVFSLLASSHLLSSSPLLPAVPPIPPFIPVLAFAVVLTLSPLPLPSLPSPLLFTAPRWAGQDGQKGMDLCRGRNLCRLRPVRCGRELSFRQGQPLTPLPSSLHLLPPQQLSLPNRRGLREVFRPPATRCHFPQAPLLLHRALRHRDDPAIAKLVAVCKPHAVVPWAV